MRRNTISSRPALLSKYHFPFFATMGIGTGQSSSPMDRMARLEFFGSMTTAFFSPAFAANALATFLSRTGVR